MPHPSFSRLTEVDPITMRRRAMIASLLGLTSAASLPAWAASASTTPDIDHTTSRGTWAQDFTAASWELDKIGSRYVTHEGALDRHFMTDSGLWLASQLGVLAERAPAHRTREARRVAAEACAFTAGCYIDSGDNKAATDLYDRAYRLADGHDDLRAFVWTQWSWVAMYTGDWHKVLRRSEYALQTADRTGGYGLLMGHAHRAKALAVIASPAAARDALDQLAASLKRVPAADAPHSALRYSWSKANFSAATVYAELGDADQQNDFQHRALEDPTLGWIDRNLMQLGHRSLDPDPEMAAQRIRFQLLSLPRDSFNYCIKQEAGRVLNKLAAKRGAGAQVKAAQTYLTHVAA